MAGQLARKVGPLLDSNLLSQNLQDSPGNLQAPTLSRRQISSLGERRDTQPCREVRAWTTC